MSGVVVLYGNREVCGIRDMPVFRKVSNSVLNTDVTYSSHEVLRHQLQAAVRGHSNSGVYSIGPSRMIVS